MPGVHVLVLLPAVSQPGVDSREKGLEEPRLSGFDPVEAIAGEIEHRNCGPEEGIAGCLSERSVAGDHEHRFQKEGPVYMHMLPIFALLRTQEFLHCSSMLPVVSVV